MTSLRRDDRGYVMVPVIGLLVITLMLGFALLSVVDTQSQASDKDRKADQTFNAAESVLRTAVTAIGSPAAWMGPDAQPCGTRTFTATDTRGTQFGTDLQQLMTRTLGTGADVWTVNVCGMATATEAWSDSYLTTRVTGSTAAVPTRVWIRAQSTARGHRRAVVTRADLQTVSVPLPDRYAIATGALGTSDLGLTTNTVLGGLLGNLLGGGNLVKDSGAKIGVRCGLLNLVDPSPDTSSLCLAGGIASVDSFSNLLGTGALTDALGTNRFEQLPTNKVATAAQLAAYRAEAQRQGTYYASVSNGAACLPAGTSASSVVFIEEVAASGTCRIDAATPGRRAAILVVKTGRVLVYGDGNTNNHPGGSAENATFTGVIYGANQTSTGGDLGGTIVTMQNRGWVKGAVLVDGNGRTQLDVPPVSVTSALCNLLPVLARVTCAVLAPLGILNTVLAALGVEAVVNALLPQVADYTAAQRDTALIAAAATAVATGSRTGPGTFSQVTPTA